ncbi:MAG TPA: hypothetical protein VKX25_15765 [Bryobacteraceae bacterium]|jgi:hypothetical protein|nr:hypothetical protein [Bryobacteraceae bacterium]
MWSWRKKVVKEGLPEAFRVQRIGIEAATVIADSAPADVAKYFRDNPLIAKRLLAESYDKRFTPSTFMEEHGSGFRVGWYSNERECVREFSNLADAATDYLLFSLGKGRWMPPGARD